MSNEKVEDGSLYYYEVMERCHVIQAMISELLHDHPAIKCDAKAQKNLDIAQSALFDIYKNAGDKYWDDFEPEGRRRANEAQAKRDKEQQCKHGIHIMSCFECSPIGGT